MTKKRESRPKMPNLALVNVEAPKTGEAGRGSPPQTRCLWSMLLWLPPCETVSTELQHPCRCRQRHLAQE